MAIKLSQEIQEIWNLEDKAKLKEVLIAMKQCIEELARKGQPMQMELRTSVPTTDDLEEGEVVRNTNNNIYTKLNGVIRTIATS